MNVKDLQEKIEDFIKTNDLDSSAEFRVLDLVSEVGEVAKEILKMTKYGTKKIERNKQVESELGDVFYSLIVVANKFDVDLEEALNLVLGKYQRRLKKGSAGSEVEKK